MKRCKTTLYRQDARLHKKIIKNASFNIAIFLSVGKSVYILGTEFMTSYISIICHNNYINKGMHELMRGNTYT